MGAPSLGTDLSVQDHLGGFSEELGYVMSGVPQKINLMPHKVTVGTAQLPKMAP